MGKIQKLSKKAINLSMTFGLLTTTLFSPISLLRTTPVTAETTPATLEPGETIDTKTQELTYTDFITQTNYIPVIINTVNAGWASTGTYNFGTFSNGAGSWLPLNYAINMEKPVHLTGFTYAKAAGKYAAQQLGDANGIIITDRPASDLSKGRRGNGLGIGNLGPNTYFLGNNYSYKYMGKCGLYKRFNTATVIARGNGSNAQILATSADYTPENGTFHKFDMKWQPIKSDNNGNVEGTLAYTSENDGVYYLAQKNITLQKSMAIGFVAATGNNYSEMSVTIGNEITASRGQQAVGIKYINTKTGQQMTPANQKWNPSTIIGSVGDTVSVVAPNTSTNTSDFIAPKAPEGYTLDSISNPITIQNFPAGTPNPNVITVNYKPKLQAGSVKYAWAEDVPGQNGIPGQLQADLPPQLKLSGYTDSPIHFPVTVPDGYVISMVHAPNGNDYTDTTIPGLTALEAALQENPTFVNGVNDFLITLSAKTQDVNFSISFDHDGSQTPPDSPGTHTITQALTGAVIDDTKINATQDWFDNWVKTQAKGWRLESYVDPKGERSIDNLKAAITGAGGYVLPGSNDYKAILAYNGALTFEEVPSQVDFGTHPVSTKLQTYTAKLDQSLKIADTRGKNSLSKWELTVRESSPIQEVNAKQKRISFANCLSYGNTILNNEDTLIYTADNPSDGETTVIDKSKTSPLALSVPIDKQKTNAKFSGTIMWTLSSTP